MHEKTVDLRQTPTNLQDLLSLIRAGTEIILTEGATPLARVVPIPSSSMPRVAGLHAGAIWVSDDFDEEQHRFLRAGPCGSIVSGRE